MLIPGPDESLAEAIKGLLSSEDEHFDLFEFAVAWARKRGVELVLPELQTFEGAVSGVVGLNYRRTSYEALRLLFEQIEELFVFYKHPFQVFHPKLYAFSRLEQDSVTSQTVIVGSSNLTFGGLSTNFEVSSSHQYDVNFGDGANRIKQIGSYFENLKSSQYSHRVSDLSFLDALLKDRYIGTERALTVSARSRSASMTRRQSARLLPEAPPPRRRFAEQVSVELPDFVTEEVSAVTEAAPVEAEYLDEIFYVRTLTENDVAKAKRETPGTWEPDLGLTARDQHPRFWGWPELYEPVAESERLEWVSKGVFSSSRSQKGMVAEIRIWFRPEREGHAAEHRFRPSAAVKDIVPDAFDANSLMVVRRLNDTNDEVFSIEFIVQGEPGFDEYSQYLANKRPGHSFGYGTVSAFED